jgi:hypothetical protein
MPAPDPFARTVVGDPAAAAAFAEIRASEPRVPTAPIMAVAPARPNPVSPMASSVMRSPGDPQPQANLPTPWNVGPVPLPAPYTPSAPAANPYLPGTMVLVQWSNGNRYAGTVLQTSGAQVLVTFPNGQQHWVDMKYVSIGT